MADEIRPYQESDYELIRPWFEARWPNAPEPEFLPKSGFIIYRDAVPLACGFLYTSQSGMSWFEFLATNPASSFSGLAALARLCRFVREVNVGRRMLIFLADTRLREFLTRKANLRSLESGVLCEFEVNL